MLIQLSSSVLRQAEETYGTDAIGIKFDSLLVSDKSMQSSRTGFSVF